MPQTHTCVLTIIGGQLLHLFYSVGHVHSDSADIARRCFFRPHILISREDITARQAITTITHLYEVIDSLILQLVDASNEIVDVLDIPDPLETVDEELLDDLLECGANPDGLRLLLAVEDEADEE